MPETTRLPNDVKQLVQRDFSGCVLTFEGQVSCWHNHFRAGPQERPGAPSTLARVRGVPRMASLAIGVEFACGLSESQEIYCWRVPRSSGDQGANMLDAVQIAVGRAKTLGVSHYNACALLESGQVACFACCFESRTPSYSTRFLTLAKPIVHFAYGAAATCFIGEDWLRCERDHQRGALEIPRSPDLDVAVGGAHGCIRGRGTLRCFGGLGFEVERKASAPADSDPWQLSEVNGASPAFASSAGVAHHCVQSPAGEIKCWGMNYFGQVSPDLEAISTSVPVSVGIFPRSFILAALHDLTCVSSPEGQHLCWGRCEHLPRLPKTTCRDGNRVKFKRPVPKEILDDPSEAPEAVLTEP